MARPRGIEDPGAYYHVVNRGSGREDIFLADNDRQVFLDGLADSCETYGIRLITYVLMSNHQSILGTQDFIDWVRQKLPRKGQREVPSLTKLQQHISVERIIGVVAKAGNAQVDDLRDRKTKLKDLRQMAMELSYRYSNYKQKEIGAIFGVDYSTVSQSRARLKIKLKSSRKLKKQFHRLLEQIDKLSNTKI